MKLELNKEAARGLWLLVAALYFTSLYFLFDLTMGDGLIVAHYAENLVDHGQLSFNLGERIWAFTSPLHTLLVANYYWLTQHSVLTNKRVSVACVLATGLMSGSHLISRTYPKRPILRPEECHGEQKEVGLTQLSAKKV